MDEFNPYAAPTEAGQPTARRSLSVLGVLADGWGLFANHWVTIFAVVTIIWLPLELFTSYVEEFVFADNDFSSSFWLMQFQTNVFGTIVSAAVIAIGLGALNDQSASIGSALVVGLRRWPAMILTRILANLAIGVGFILLVLPGIYVALRLALSEAVVVAEHRSGTGAMTRSFELTKSYVWKLLLIAIVVTLLMLGTTIVMESALAFFPEADHWLVRAGVAFVSDLMVAYGTLCFVCVYHFVARQVEEEAIPEPALTI